MPWRHGRRWTSGPSRCERGWSAVIIRRYERVRKGLVVFWLLAVRHRLAASLPERVKMACPVCFRRPLSKHVETKKRIW